MTSSKQTTETQPLPGKPITDDAILKVSKEVVIKFIEVGRLSPANFAETFDEIFNAVRKTARS